MPRLPDAVIGDFDSLVGRILIGKHGPRYLRDPDQETTDAEKALHHARAAGAVEAVLLGAVGARIDHTLFNAALLERFKDSLHLCLAGSEDDAVRVGSHQQVAWDLPAGTLFSLLPLSGPVFGVTLGGAAHPLDNAVLRVGGAAAVSNRVVQPPLRLATSGGSLLVAVRNRGWPPD